MKLNPRSKQDSRWIRNKSPDGVLHLLRVNGRWRAVAGGLFHPSVAGFPAPNEGVPVVAPSAGSRSKRVFLCLPAESACL